MTSTDWHVPPGQIDRYLAQEADAAVAASVEAHVVACASCRDTLAERSAVSGSLDLGASWAALEARIDEEAAPTLVRAANRIGIPTADVRLLAPTAAIRGRWLLAGALAFGAAAVVTRDMPLTGVASRLVFLTLAPLIPLVAVLAALGPAVEPLPELAIAAPVRRMRVVALRSIGVLVVTVGVGLAASALVPGPMAERAAWLLPSLALCGMGAHAARFLPTGVATVALTVVWLTGVTTVATLSDDRLGAFSPPAQLGYLAVALAAVAAFVVRPQVALRRIR